MSSQEVKNDASDPGASPVQIIEERIYFIQGCIDDDPENDMLYEKQEEYFVMYEELQEVTKRLSRCETLLHQSPSTKLERKRTQYIRSIEETIQYALSDDFFLQDDDGYYYYYEEEVIDDEEELIDNNNNNNSQTRVDLRDCSVRVSSCLGEPLETIIEAPGFEGNESSQKLNTRSLPGLASAQNSSASLSAGMQSSISRLQASAERGLNFNEEDDEDDDDDGYVPMRRTSMLRDDGLHLSDDDDESLVHKK